MQFTDKVDIPVVTQRQIHMNSDVQKTIEIPQLQHTDDVVDVLVVLVVQAALVQVMAKIIQISKFLFIRKSL